MYNGCWYNCLSYNSDLHAESVDLLNINSDISIPVSLSFQSDNPPKICSPLNIPKGSRL
jgi:hypothetical protein